MKFKYRTFGVILTLLFTVQVLGCTNDTETEVNSNIESSDSQDNIIKVSEDIEAFRGEVKDIKDLNYNIIGNENIAQNIVFQDEYTKLEGITTFRGNHYRNSSSYGTINMSERKLEEAWKYQTGTSSWGGGAGWTGQPAIVKWPNDIKMSMNIKDEFKQQEDFVEVIYSSLDGCIYFLDLKTGKPSRNKIVVGNPIKGTLSIDPRGLPLLYVGEGINESGVVGFNIYSLIDGKKLYELSGTDKDSYRGWPAFDSSSIIHGESDTVILGGENGILYIIKLNSKFDKEQNKIDINPEITKYRYKMGSALGRLGIENSVAIYANLVYFSDNNGYINCIDLNTMKPVWTINGGDDIDASITIEVENKTPYIYCGTEVDHQGVKGNSVLRKINGFTGEVIWNKSFFCESIVGDNATNGGLLATNVIGKNKIDDKVIFSLARNKGFNRGVTYALNKKTGEIEWEREFDNYMWSSPVDVYDKDGNGYIIQCDSAGYMWILNGTDGTVIDKILLDGNIESTPTVFNNMIVVATRNGSIYGVKIK
ncbi:MAG: PQQ-binding-like beta-propeller repeat protein [Clostridium sp.]